MNKETTRFGFIMSRMGLRANDLVEATGLDKSLVSRWKNGRRRLSSTGEQTAIIADYLLAQPGAEQTITRTLQGYGLDETTGELRDNLIFWLSEQDLPEPPFTTPKKDRSKKEFTASFNVYLGINSMYNSVITMIDYVLTLPAGEEIIIIVRGNYHWVMGSKLFINYLLELAEKCKELGIKVTIAHAASLVRHGDIVSFMAEWYWAYQKDYIDIRQFDNDIPCEYKIMASVKDGICLVMREDKSAPDDLYVGVYTDGVTVRQIHNLCSRFKQDSWSYFHNQFFKNPANILSGLDPAVILSEPRYVVCEAPSFGTFYAEQSAEILGVNPEDIDRYVSQLKCLFFEPPKFSAEASVRHIFCLETVREILAAGRRRAPALSQALGHDIYHSEKKMRIQLTNIRNWLRELYNYEVMLLPRRHYQRIMVDFVAQSGSFSVVWLPENPESASALTTQPHLGVTYLFGNYIWDKAPKYHKDRKRTLKLLDELLDS